MRMEDLSTVSLTAWTAKLESHIQDLQKMLQIHSATKKMNKFYDNDSKDKNIIIAKLNEVAAKLNEVFKEIDNRAKKELGIDFDIESLSILSAKIDGDYIKQKKLIDDKAKKELDKIAKKPKLVK